ncbi:MAG: vWA domain-containing protein [Dehalococcoidia bacterium]|jgi:Mg-chelatase subunit ChlD
MIGKIIGIRVIKTQSNDEPPIISGRTMISDRTEKTIYGMTNIQHENMKGIVYLVVDCSGSMEGYKMSQVKQGILEFAEDAIKKEYTVGLIKFDSKATHLCEPKSSVGDLRAHLDNLVATGSTNMASAIAMANEHLSDVRYTRVMVIATDGRPDRTAFALQAGQIAKNEGIDIITIGTDDADVSFLQKLATSAELGNKVSNEQFAKAIGSAHKLLPDPNRTAVQSNLSSHDLGERVQYAGRYSYSFSG